MKTKAFDREVWIARRIWKRLHEQNTNALVGIFGLPGVGKTYTAFRIAELVDPGFNIDRIVFTIPDLIHLINGPPRLPRGSAIVLDDASQAANSRKWQSPVNQALSDVGNTFRFEGYLVLVTARLSGIIDSQFRSLFHLTLEIKSRDMATKTIKAKPRTVSMDTAHGKTYYPYLRLKIPGRGTPRVTRIRFHVSHFQHGPRLTWPEYEARKAAFMRSHYRKLEKDLREDERFSGHVPLWSRKLLIVAKESGLSYRKLAPKIGISHSAMSQLVADVEQDG